jgi:hypothetical protein
MGAPALIDRADVRFVCGLVCQVGVNGGWYVTRFSMLFRPLPETRVANMLPGLALVAICVNVVVEGNDVPRPVVWIGIVLGLALAVCGYRMGVLIADGSVTVRGFAWSRKVHVSEVVTVSGGTIPMLRWRTASRRVRWSPIVAFMDSYRGMPRYAEHNRKSLRLLRLTIGRSRLR